MFMITMIFLKLGAVMQFLRGEKFADAAEEGGSNNEARVLLMLPRKGS